MGLALWTVRHGTYQKRGFTGPRLVATPGLLMLILARAAEDQLCARFINVFLTR